MDAAVSLPTSIPQKAERIIEAAALEFLEMGYSHAKLESIARRARVAIATVYACFPGKADIFHAVVTSTLSSSDPVGAALQSHRGVDARGRLMAFAVAYTATVVSPFSRALCRGIVAEQPRFPDLARAAAEQAYNLTGGHLVALIEDLAAAGDIAVAEPVTAAAQLQGMLDFPTLLVGLLFGDHAEPTIALPHLCEEAVETFLARYGRPAKACDLGG